MVLVERAHARVIDNAIESARTGHPTVLVVEGVPGAGKSTLIGHIASRAEGYRSCTAEGDDSEHGTPFRTLESWGITVARGADGTIPTPFVVAQHLRDLVDDLGTGGPVLLQLDDLQWADPESVQALTWLLERVAGDRLLVVAGTRPLAPRDHDAWQRFVASSHNVHKLQLSGLSIDLATDLIQGVHPGVSADVAHYLWEHTGGNPLYLTSLLREHDRAELSRMRVLPAPAEFARTLSARVEQLSEPAIRMLRATAVLGPNWLALPEVALVAQVDAPTDAAAELAAHELLLQRATNPGLSIRLPHALIRAAVYQYIPLPERRQLHLRAAEVVDDESSSLEHRLAAAEQFDDALADELEAFARERHAHREHRIASQHYRWSSRVTSSSLDRNRRWLDGLFESALAGDIALVQDELADNPNSRDRVRRALVSGAIEVFASNWRSALQTFAAVEKEQTDSLTRYRLEVLTGWCRLCSGGETDDVLRALGIATNQAQQDRSLDDFLSFGLGMTGGRTGDITAIVDTFASLPRIPSTIPIHLTYSLAWRGVLYLRRGFPDEAIADLSEVDRRIQDGLPDISDSLFATSLAMALLNAGQVAVAEAKMRVVLDSARDPNNRLLQILAAWVHITLGDLERADEHLRNATELLRQMPWPEAIEPLFSVQVLRLLTSDDHGARERLIGTHRSMFGPRALDPEGSMSPFWILHAAIAYVWADELDNATGLLARIQHDVLTPEWILLSGERWVQGLIAEARGDNPGALTLFDEAEANWPDTVPLYRAHMHLDRARVAERLGDQQAAATSRATARGIYEKAGAVGYLALLSEPDEASDVHASLAMLSDRERDVVALLASGLSYVQIARDLYISRSTVGFHLSNIYAKTGTSSRHELTDLVRA
jgi:DNA-binding CsgD family transcriptional regulator